MKRLPIYRLIVITFIYSFISSFTSMRKVSAITCSICGQSNLTAPGECTNQFQYDCSTNANVQQANQQQEQPHAAITTTIRQSKMLCRTTRTKLAENIYAVAKECVTENEHLNRYPEGRAFGCESIRPNGSYPITYCVCDQDLCNVPSLDEQLKQPQQPFLLADGSAAAVDADIQGQQRRQQPTPLPNNKNQNPIIQTIPVSGQQPQRPIQSSNPEIGAVVSPSQQRSFQPQPVEILRRSGSPNPNPTVVQQNQARPETGQVTAATTWTQRQQLPLPPAEIPQQQATTPLILVPLNTERVQFLTDPPPPRPIGTGIANGSTAGFFCMVCGEGNLTSGQDCQIQNPLDCRNIFQPGATLYCFTKSVSLSTGETQIEKRCASEEQLAQELGLPSIQPSCSHAQNGHVNIDYCICDNSKCNQLPIATQAHMYPPLTPSDFEQRQSPGVNAATPQQQPSGINAVKTKMCHICGESDQAHPSDCSQQYEYDCSRQYPAGSTILCLTRQTKVASGRFNIEKRCITPTEHQQQYPDNEVTLNGCNEAWSGYVQYCVCQGDFCNARNITIQQTHFNRTQKPSDLPPEDHYDNYDLPQNGTPDQQQQQQLPRHRGSLLPQPSTRLPLVPASRNPDILPTTISNGVQENNNRQQQQQPVSRADNALDNNNRLHPTDPSPQQGQNAKHRPIPPKRIRPSEIVTDSSDKVSSKPALLIVCLASILNAILNC